MIRNKSPGQNRAIELSRIHPGCNMNKATSLTNSQAEGKRINSEQTGETESGSLLYELGSEVQTVGPRSSDHHERGSSLTPSTERMVDYNKTSTPSVSDLKSVDSAQ